MKSKTISKCITLMTSSGSLGIMLDLDQIFLVGTHQMNCFVAFSKTLDLIRLHTLSFVNVHDQ